MIKEFEEKGIKKIHFIGIGGVSMSSLAKFVKKQGYEVSGSDRNICQDNFADYGIKVFTGHDENNLNDVDAVVYNSAINNLNPEFTAAMSKSLPIYTRAQLLSAVCNCFDKSIGIAGCHGKTTVCSMVSTIFKYCEMKFYAHVGGYDVDFGNYYYTGNDYIVSEVCEYKKNIKYFHPAIACLLNVAPDHMDCYESVDDLLNEYFNFLDRGELRVYNGDDKYLKNYKSDNAVTFGLEENNSIRAVDLRLSGGRYSFKVVENGDVADEVNLKVYGLHSVYNALAAFTVSRCCGVKAQDIIAALNNYKGVVRRFENIGKLNGAEVIADYAHHPDEIEESIKTASYICDKNLHIIFQPHTYSRTKFLFNDFIKVFKNAENIAIFKTFSAREKPQDGYDGKYLSERLPQSEYFENIDELLSYEKDKLSDGDVLLVLGAGDIYNLIKDKINS